MIEFRKINLHDLVKTNDGYYAIVTKIFLDSHTVEIFQGNGLRCHVESSTLTKLGIKDGYKSPANFAELYRR